MPISAPGLAALRHMAYEGNSSKAAVKLAKKSPEDLSRCQELIQNKITAVENRLAALPQKIDAMKASPSVVTRFRLALHPSRCSLEEQSKSLAKDVLKYHNRLRAITPTEVSGPRYAESPRVARPPTKEASDVPSSTR